MKDLSYFARCLGLVCLTLLSVSLNAAESCDPNDDCAEGELLDGHITYTGPSASEVSAHLTANKDADFFKSAGLRCDRLASSLGGYKGSGEVMPYIEASWNNFDQKSSMQRKLRRLINKYPAHPALNWQAGWLSFMKRDFEETITLWTIAANQGEPNAAFNLAWIGLGLQDADVGLLAKCIEVAAKSDLDILIDGGSYGQWFKEDATSTLAGLYIHDLKNVPSFESRSLPNINWHPVPYNPELASELFQSLPRKNIYISLRDKIKSGVSELQAEERRRKEVEQKLAKADKEEAHRRYTESLQLTANQLTSLEDKCAAYSTIKGLCWALDLHEMKSVLASRGYLASKHSTNIFQLHRFSSIVFKNSVVTFDCGVLNACNLSMRELSNRLQQSDIVIGAMEWDSEYSAFEQISSTTKSLCGRGRQGEKICVSQTYTSAGSLSGTDVVKVILGKGLVGTEVTFD